MTLENQEDKVVKLPRVKRASKRIAKSLKKWLEDHQKRRYKRAILITLTEDGVQISDSGFNTNEEHVFRGMLDFVRDSWDWESSE